MAALRLARTATADFFRQFGCDTDRGANMTAPGRHRPVVTVAALYGAGGSVIGPQVAERLDVPFLDRALPDAVTQQTGSPPDAVADVDDQPRNALK